ncbi:MAG: magnesium transporter [Lachnospiraceae bacterium]|jgi:magnesium transporter|nr:magnesium transporter [Lachnospiraceae bacterium]
MQKVIYRSEIENYTQQMEAAVVKYIEEGQIETFEGFDNFSIIAFDWYDIKNLEADPSQMLLYFDTDDLFVICENEVSYEAATKYFSEAPSNERSMYLFFKNLFKGDTKNLEELEDRISDLDDAVIHDGSEEIREKILDARYEVLRLKKYYEQFEEIFDELCDNDNEMISADYINYFDVLNNRCERLLRQVLNLKEYVVQVRESYQAQIDIEQNRLMKVFTLMTSIFLPLTLIAGWYGMNLQMPEFGWKYGYPVVIFVCLLVCVIWAIVFKKKGWFK